MSRSRVQKRKVPRDPYQYLQGMQFCIGNCLICPDNRLCVFSDVSEDELDDELDDDET